MLENLLPALIGALVGGFITMLGWIANYYLGRKKDIETRQRETRLKYLQQQIEELYAPIWSLVEQSKAIYAVACQRLPVSANGRIDRTKFTQQDNEIFQFFNETYHLPINSKVAQIIQTKLHLLKDGAMPPVFNEFIKHQVTSESLYRLWKEKNIASTSVQGVKYPEAFNDEVKIVLDDLRRQYLCEINLLTKPGKKKGKG